MKKTMVVCLLWIAFPSGASAQETGDVGMFYSSLSPHGEWISVDGGTYAWRPAGVEAGWRPYNNGRWVWTEDGWYWSSEEPWAWATYHYGRWYNDDFYGWVWVPGYDWAPAWVEWRYGGSYVGWAPLGPYAVFSVGWGIHYQRYWATPVSYWSFVDCNYICTPYVNQYVYRADDNMRFIGRTRTTGSVRSENGRIVTGGPDREFVERRGNIRVDRVDMVDVGDRSAAGVVREGGRERVSVYRPKIGVNDRPGAAARPDRVRTDDHRIGLDTRGTDIRRADGDRGERDLRRAEDYRQPQRMRPLENSIDLGRTPTGIRPDVSREHPAVRPDRPSSVRPGNEAQNPRREPAVSRAPQRLSASPHLQAEPGRSPAPRTATPRPAESGRGEKGRR